MNWVRSRSAKSLVCALAATAASFLLAACSTSSDGQGTFALASSALGTPEDGAAEPAEAGQAQAGQADAASGGEGAGLPKKVAYLPAMKPGSAFPEAGLAAEAEATDTKAPTAPGAKAVEADKAVDAKVDASEQKPSAEQVMTAAPAAAKGEQIMTAADPAQAEAAPKKRGFLASLFSANEASAAPAPQKPQALVSEKKQEKAIVEKEKAEALVKLASIEPAEQMDISRSSTGSYGSDALPGVRKSALFEIRHKSGIDDDSDVDLHEDDMFPPIRVASAAGMARLAPNGLLKQTQGVDVACLKPSLVRTLRQIEQHFGRKVMVTSGYRSPSYNRRVNGAKRSQHMFCAAADIQVAGVSKWELAKYARTMPGRGGVGTYCHTESVHVDIGPERDWNWRCRRRKA